MNKFTHGLVTEIRNASLIHFAEGVDDVIKALNDRRDEYICSDLFKEKVAADNARNDRRRTTIAWTEHEISKLMLQEGQLHKGNLIKVAGTRDGHGMRIFQGFDGNDRIICTKLEQHNLYHLYKDSAEIYLFEKKCYVAGYEATTHDPGKIRKILIGGVWQTKTVIDWDGKVLGNRNVHVLKVHRDLVKEVKK